jgi:hypothetical protein
VRHDAVVRLLRRVIHRVLPLTGRTHRAGANACVVALTSAQAGRLTTQRRHPIPPALGIAMIQPATSPAHAAPAAHEPASGSSAGARLVNLVVDPVAAFRGIGTHPPWALAFMIVIVVRFGSLFVFYRPAVTALKVVAGLLFQLATIAPALLVASLVVWLAAKVWHVGVSWTSSFSVVTHVYVAYTLATIAFASVAGALLPESAEVDLRHPPFTNFASLLDDDTSTVVSRLVGEIDVRSAYALWLLWLGLRGAAPDAARYDVTSVVATIGVVRLAGLGALALLR